MDTTTQTECTESIQCFDKLKRNVVKNASLSLKLDAYCSYIAPIVSCSSRYLKANRTELKYIEKVKRKKKRS